jgi:hypothetical protein
MDKYKITLTLTEEMLGAVPKDEEVYETWVANNTTSENLDEEMDTVPGNGFDEEKGWTGFHMADGKPIEYNYVIKGFFKDACGMLRRASDTKSKNLWAYKKVIDGLVFVFPRQIVLNLPDGVEMGVNERPLRAQTAQGERVALARSDTVPAGTTMEFEVHTLGQVSQALLEEWLDYGCLRGLRQWRNAGFGTFTYELEKLG